MKRIACIVLLAAAACGGSAGPEPRREGTAGGIPLRGLGPLVTVAKVVVKTPTTTNVEVLEVNGEFEIPIACTDNTPCGALPAFCDVVPANPTFHECVVPVTKTTIFYVQNIDPVTSSSTIRIPCDGRVYAIELYAAAKGTPNDISAVYTGSASFAAGCTGGLTAPGLVPTPLAAMPSLATPTVYVGITAPPYDKYTVGLVNGGYPWSARSVTCGGHAPDPGTIARFPAPTVAGDIACGGVFNLDTSLLTSGDVPWRYTANATITPIDTGGIDFPP